MLLKQKIGLLLFQLLAAIFWAVEAAHHSPLISGKLPTFGLVPNYHGFASQYPYHVRLFDIRGGESDTEETTSGGKDDTCDDPIPELSATLISINSVLIGLLESEAEVIEQTLEKYLQQVAKEKRKNKKKIKVFVRGMADQVEEIRSQAEFLRDVTVTSVDDYGRNILSTLYGEYSSFLYDLEDILRASRYLRFARYVRKHGNIFDDISEYLEGANGLTEAVLSSVLVGYYKERGALIQSQASDFFKVNRQLEGKVYVQYAGELFNQAELLAEGVV